MFAASVDQNDRRKNSPLPSTIIKTWPICGPCYLWNETVDLLNNSDRSRNNMNKREQDFTQFKLNILFQENSSCADLPGTTYWKALQNIFKKNYGNLRGWNQIEVRNTPTAILMCIRGVFWEKPRDTGSGHCYNPYLSQTFPLPQEL